MGGRKGVMVSEDGIKRGKMFGDWWGMVWGGDGVVVGW